MAKADDPEVPGHRPRPAASFWQRYSGRPAEPAQDEQSGEDPFDDGDDASSGAAHASQPGSAEPAGDEHGPDGGASPGGEHGPASLPHNHVDGHQCLEWCPICRGAEMLRAAVPPELQEQFQIVQRDALLLAQALIEAQLERLKREGESDDPDISSIPID